MSLAGDSSKIFLLARLFCEKYHLQKYDFSEKRSPGTRSHNEVVFLSLKGLGIFPTRSIGAILAKMDPYALLAHIVKVGDMGLLGVNIGVEEGIIFLIFHQRYHDLVPSIRI